MLDNTSAYRTAAFTVLMLAVLTTCYVAYVQSLSAVSQGSYPLINESNTTAYLFVYGSVGCKACVSLKEFLLEHYSNITIFCDIATNTSCRVRFFDMISKYEMPPEIPTVFVVGKEGIVAVVIGDVKNLTFWNELIQSAPKSLTKIPIYGGCYRIIKYLIVENQTEFVGEYLPEISHFTKIAPSTTPAVPLSGPELFATVSVLALNDSVNPCCIYVYVTLLIATATYGMRASTSLRRAMVTSGLPFIISVYVGYYLLGVGLTKAFAYIPLKLFGIVAIVFGLWIVLTSEAESRVIGREKILRLIPRAKSSVLMSAVLGFLVTYAVLPCSAGPYVVFTGIISRLGLTSALMWLAYYNLIFVLPLIVVLVASLKVAEAAKVREFIIRYSKVLSAAMGVVLIGLGIYILLQY